MDCDTEQRAAEARNCLISATCDYLAASFSREDAPHHDDSVEYAADYVDKAAAALCEAQGYLPPDEAAKLRGQLHEIGQLRMYPGDGTKFVLAGDLVRILFPDGADRPVPDGMGPGGQTYLTTYAEYLGVTPTAKDELALVFAGVIRDFPWDVYGLTGQFFSAWGPELVKAAAEAVVARFADSTTVQPQQDGQIAAVASTAADHEALRDTWNATHPVGTVVRYWRGIRETEPSGTGATRSKAWMLSGHTPVVLIEGCSGAVALTHVEAVENPPEDKSQETQ